MIYGSKKVYEEYKRIGIDLFLDEFELNGIEDKDEFEQIDMIISSLKISIKSIFLYSEGESYLISLFFNTSIKNFSAYDGCLPNLLAHPLCFPSFTNFS
jgi:hypothetical protein